MLDINTMSQIRNDCVVLDRLVSARVGGWRLQLLVTNRANVPLYGVRVALVTRWNNDIRLIRLFLLHFLRLQVP